MCASVAILLAVLAGLRFGTSRQSAMSTHTTCPLPPIQQIWSSLVLLPAGDSN
ncbi:hypothetical protein PR003_g2757 [Phytophthora rubi]|uniref:RxLR effector protein n=1 Tax=Phytophthora rubi TaxID=129364 RepID=A0A6A4FRV1_9STRA|nr:hypothetical protein PR003_g2757 [Phytophthora rubi]